MLKNTTTMTPQLWEMHLSRQFQWTRCLRQKIYDYVNIKSADSVLDCGCGIGMLAREVSELAGCKMTGIDINPDLLDMARKKCPDGEFAKASIEKLPFPDDTFDVTFCHFVLMWLKKPQTAMDEMKRVTRPGGWVVCGGEPDYGAKIDYPDEFNTVAAGIHALQREGADPFFGRKLKATFAGAGLRPHMDVFVDLWDDDRMRDEFEHTWKFQRLTTTGKMSLEFLERVQARDRLALDRGQRVTLLPVFWGAARVPRQEDDSSRENQD